MERPQQLVILAGGLGTRLSTKECLPKCLVPIGTTTVLAQQLAVASREGIRRVLLLLGHGSETIRKFCMENRAPDLDLTFAEDPFPGGTAGALHAAMPLLDAQFFLCYGDTFFDLDFGALHSVFRKHHPAAALLAHPTNHPQDSDLLECDTKGNVLAVHSPRKDGVPPPRNLSNAAFYVLDREKIASPLRDLSRGDIAKDLFPLLLKNGAGMVALHSREYIRDMGTPERLEIVRADVASGLPQMRRNNNPIPAIFLDRDGTINRPNGWIARPEDLDLLPGAAAAVRRINLSGCMAVVVTNQPVIARGECTEEELNAIHAQLDQLLGHSGAFLDALYFCPHHPDKGWKGERAELKIPCDCRKPAPGMLLQAIRDWNIDPARSWMIGDSWRDVGAANNAGVRSIFLGGRETSLPGGFTPDLFADNLADAVNHALNH